MHPGRGGGCRGWRTRDKGFSKPPAELLPLAHGCSQACPSLLTPHPCVPLSFYTLPCASFGRRYLPLRSLKQMMLRSEVTQAAPAGSYGKGIKNNNGPAANPTQIFRLTFTFKATATPVPDTLSGSALAEIMDKLITNKSGSLFGSAHSTCSPRPHRQHVPAAPCGPTLWRCSRRSCSHTCTPLRAVRADKQLEQADGSTLQLISDLTRRAVAFIY